MERTAQFQTLNGKVTNNNAISCAHSLRLKIFLKCALDIRLRTQSKVRIAEEPICKGLVRTFMVVLITLSMKCSMSISFDTIVYDKHKPTETMVPSYYNSRERQQFQVKVLKNVKVSKNLHRS
ncbi:hypothetical protein EG348_18045 [Chryseobacterium sp. G0201]|nr:hypothetical protein EG348_18045 [Chryseobacterium sp. G0201]